MKVLIPAICQQGQVYSNFWLSCLEAQTQAAKHNSDLYRRIEEELTQKIIQQIPGFTMEDPKHVKILQDSRNLPQNQHQFTMAYQKESIELHYYAMGGESLLGRGRNHVAQVAMTQGFDKLFFVDCDEGFTWADLTTLIFSKYPLSSGVVPLKTYPHEKANPATFETTLNFMPFLEDEIFFDNSLRTLTSALRMARAYKSKWLKMAFAGSGFMCVDVKSVLMPLAESADEYLYPNPRTNNPELHWSFFDGGPLDGHFLSEDWIFCDQVRKKLGFDVMVNVDVRINHCGPHLFTAR